MKYKKLIILFVVLIGILILNFKVFIYDEKYEIKDNVEYTGDTKSDLNNFKIC